LRDRDEDLEELARGFLKTFALKHGRPAEQFSGETWKFLRAYDFPGNVRELANIIERAVIVSTSAEIGAADLPESMRVAAARRERKAQRPTLAEVESEYIHETLTASKGNKTEAARILGISRKNLYERLAREEKRDVAQTPVFDEPTSESPSEV